MTRHQTIVRALGGKLSLGAFCIATSGAAILESWSVLLTGMAVFVGLLVWDVHSGRHRPRPTRIPDGSTFKNGAVREAVEAIGAAQKERLEALDSCPDDILTLLDGLLRTAADVEVAAVRIARRAERLHGYLSRKDLGFVRRTAHAAQQSAERARTRCEQENYQAAARTHEIEVQTLESIEMGLRVTLAKLENIRATLAALPPRIVKLQATSADMGDTSYMRLSDDLRTAHGELDEVEQHLQCLARGGDGELGDEPEQMEPSRVEPGRVEPSRVEPSRVEPSRVEPSRVEPARTEQARIEQARIEHGRVEHERIAAARLDIRIAMTPAMPGAEAVELEEASARDLRGVNRLMY